MRGVIKKEISGKEVGFKFGMNFYFSISEHKEMTIAEFLESLASLNEEAEDGQMIFNLQKGFPVIREILYFSAKTYNDEKGIESDFNLFTAGNWFDEIGIEGVMDILSCMVESQSVGEQVEKHLKKNQKAEVKTQS